MTHQGEVFLGLKAPGGGSIAPAQGICYTPHIQLVEMLVGRGLATISSKTSFVLNSNPLMLCKPSLVAIFALLSHRGSSFWQSDEFVLTKWVIFGSNPLLEARLFALKDVKTTQQGFEFFAAPLHFVIVVKRVKSSFFVANVV